MNYGNYAEDYPELFELLYNKIPVVTLRQLALYVKYIYGLGFESAKKLIFHLSQESYLILTHNNYVTTREKVFAISRVPPRIILDTHLILKENLYLKKQYLDMVEAFWLVIENIATVEDFFFCNPPVVMCYTDRKKERLIEVIKFPAGKEYLYNELIKLHFCYDKEGRKLVERYAFVEDETVIDIIKGYGFTEFYTLTTRGKDQALKKLDKKIEFQFAWKDVVDNDINIEQFSRTFDYDEIS